MTVPRMDFDKVTEPNERNHLMNDKPTVYRQLNRVQPPTISDFRRFTAVQRRLQIQGVATDLSEPANSRFEYSC
jgi:hypothetical protein